MSSNKVFLVSLLSLILITGCSDEERLDKALTIGAQTTSSVFIDECSRKYEELIDSSLEAEKLVSAGLEESKAYFISIDEKKWIDEAVEIANKSLKMAAPGMTEEKCLNFIDEIIKDGGIQKGRRFRDYYSARQNDQVH